MNQISLKNAALIVAVLILSAACSVGLVMWLGQQVLSPVSMVVHSTRVRDLWLLESNKTGQTKRGYLQVSPFCLDHLIFFTRTVQFFYLLHALRHNAGMNVSVIVTVYNEHDNIIRLLDSLADQSRKPDEVVICDGGSQDGTAEFVQIMPATTRSIAQSPPDR